MTWLQRPTVSLAGLNDEARCDTRLGCLFTRRRESRLGSGRADDVKQGAGHDERDALQGYRDPAIENQILMLQEIQIDTDINTSGCKTQVPGWRPSVPSAAGSQEVCSGWTRTM
ncbi:hypothetical protein CSOJ01_02917 [Colletotrichum sojae]|uniref:Uncharacterized protein n=1 Tax=Colletotrichum sojae TaxID=2175907 RepID=A0A8H6JP14_9PEZI|nr:hypothetical protein CSOJ01_02917 [Colletotrichum sojae]